MGWYLITDTLLTNIANAVRKVCGDTTKRTPAQMATALNNLNISKSAMGSATSSTTMTVYAKRYDGSSVSASTGTNCARVAIPSGMNVKAMAWTNSSGNAVWQSGFIDFSASNGYCWGSTGILFYIYNTNNTLKDSSYVYFPTGRSGSVVQYMLIE